MALQLFDLNRAGDTPIATLKLSEITPTDWPKPTLPVANATPIYVPTVSFVGGAVGDDVDQATAASTTAYSPRTQTEKASMMVPPGSLAVDIGRPRGALEPDDPYPKAGDTPLAAPVITSLAPNTAVHGTPSISVLINGTGFTPWSTVTSGGVPIPVKYISPTVLQIIQNALYSVAGTVQVVVTDHNVRSAPSNFVFT
jgi:hypothetical protein